MKMKGKKILKGNTGQECWGAFAGRGAKNGVKSASSVTERRSPPKGGITGCQRAVAAEKNKGRSLTIASKNVVRP